MNSLNAPYIYDFVCVFCHVLRLNTFRLTLAMHPHAQHSMWTAHILNSDFYREWIKKEHAPYIMKIQCNTNHMLPIHWLGSNLITERRNTSHVDWKSIERKLKLKIRECQTSMYSSSSSSMKYHKQPNKLSVFKSKTILISRGEYLVQHRLWFRPTAQVLQKQQQRKPNKFPVLREMRTKNVFSQ